MSKCIRNAFQHPSQQRAVVLLVGNILLILDQRKFEEKKTP